MKIPSTAMIQTLLQHSMFAGIANHDIDVLMQEVSVCCLNKKEHLLYCGDALTHYYYVLSGTIQLYRPTADGEEKVFYLVKSNEMFFTAKAFSSKSIAPFSVMALEPSVVLQLSATQLYNVTKTCPNLGSNLLTEISDYYYRAVNRIDVLTTSNASQRVVLYLLDLADIYGTMQFHLPLTQRALAKQLNITPETLSRIIHRLCTTQFLQYEHNTFHIISPNQLKAYVNLPTHTCCCQSCYSSFTL